MKISILIEGDTERVFIPVVRSFLSVRLQGEMPRLDPVICDGRIPKEDKLRRMVVNLLSGREASDAVIALTDVYTGTNDFIGADDAKKKMLAWVENEPRFYPHVALHDFEAWLLPYWPEIQKLAGSTRQSPGPHPETINRDNPPAHRIAEIFRTGTVGRKYVKPRDALRILKNADLSVSANACPELKALLNTILQLCGETILT